MALYTIGYEKRSLDEFIGLLRAAGIGVLVDVRQNAWSRKPGFSKQPLGAALEAAGIAYVHAGFAGNPTRFDAPPAGAAGPLDAYRRHLDAHPDVVRELAKLLDAWSARDARACIACFERRPEDCHRSILAERWRADRGGEVVHLGIADAPPELPLDP